MGPLEYIVDKMPKYEQDFCIVIPKYRKIQVENQFTIGKEVLEFRDLPRELGGLHNRSFRVDRFRGLHRLCREHRRQYRCLQVVHSLLYQYYLSVQKYIFFLKAD